ncbi:hypothetical protein FOL47_010290 [Perkinsus chesapeaki]|uniref:Cytochrome P450 n=1 Tax=Perkinsus chesapeaki TaxID=330153 RepID=A0A7J6L4D4_PERCH|nr:hypothetical protein FOL47_010290 [Perkinsus chesapeaki]
MQTTMLVRQYKPSNEFLYVEGYFEDELGAQFEYHIDLYGNRGSKPPEHSSEEVQQGIKDALVGANAALDMAIFPWATRDRFPWNLNPMIKKLHTGMRRMKTICQEIIGMRRAEKIRGESKERDDLLDKLMHLEKDDLQGNLITFLFAGSETTSTTVAWCLYYLCLYPNIQTKARDEVDKLGRDPAVDADLDLLPYTQCCILETLRLTPPGPFLPHKCMHRTRLGEEEILPGTVVLTVMSKAMKTIKEGGTSYVPERWLSSDGCGIDKDRARDHLAFGGGPRQCPGQAMALKEATVLLAMILRHFDNIEHSHDISAVKGVDWFTYQPTGLELDMSVRSVDQTQT